MYAVATSEKWSIWLLPITLFNPSSPVIGRGRFFASILSAN